ncbi:MAG: AAA family ATPase [Xanthobacteraceae bacterium]|nr:AAA family ATPase [Xanthobacteraceae bacterium]
MRLQSVEMCGFRGFKERTVFSFAPGFVVFCGRNGAGKSTVLDAIDFAVTGTINKFTVTRAKGGGLDAHIWWVGSGNAEAHYVTVTFVCEDGTSFWIRRDKDGLLQSDSEVLFRKLCGTDGENAESIETLMRTTLIRDESIVSLSVDLPEQARAAVVRAAIGGLLGPDYSSRTESLVDAANEIRNKQQRGVDEAQSQLGRFLSELTEAQSAADRVPDISDAMRVIKEYAPALPEDQQRHPGTIRQILADRRVAIEEAERARKLSESLLPEWNFVASEAGQNELDSIVARFEEAGRQNEEAELALKEAELKDASEKESDMLASHLAAIVSHGEELGLQDGHCPLCDALRTSEQFKQGIELARTKLATRGVNLELYRIALEQARGNADRASGEVQRLGLLAASEISRRSELKVKIARINEVYEKYGFDLLAEDPNHANDIILQETDRLNRVERALHVLEISNTASLVASLESKVQSARNHLEAETSKLNALEKAHEVAKSIDHSAKALANQLVTEQFDTVMPLLKEVYRRLRPHADWSEINSDFGGKVKASLNFTVGDGHNIQFLFSSGQRRAAGLAFLLTIHLARRWSDWKSLLLDDPVQHIDDYRALNFVEVLSAIRQTGRQVIVAVEDAALADLLCRRLRSTSEQIGRRFELRTTGGGASEILDVRDILPMSSEVMREARVS